MAWEGLNRRKFPRAAFPCLIKVRRDDDPDDVVLTHTENLSLGGVCVIIKRQLPAFATFPLEIDLMDGEDVVVCRGKVVWTVRRKAIEEFKPSFYDTGMELIDLGDLARARFERVVAALAKGSSVRTR